MVENDDNDGISHQGFGAPRTWNSQVWRLRTRLIEKVAAARRITKQEACGIVDAHLIGGQQLQAIDVADVTGDVAGVEKATADYGKQDWKTASMLAQSEDGARRTWIRRIHESGEKLVGDIMRTGAPKEEARAIVDTHLVGMRKPARGQPALAVSPDALRILKAEWPAALEPGWKTGNMLARSEGGGDYRVWTKRIRELGEALVGDIMRTGAPKEEARAIVAANLVGMRQLVKGRPAVAVSPEALRILLEQHRAKKEKTSSPEDPPRSR